MIHFDLPKQKSSIIKVLGVGGGGSNAVNFMQAQTIEGVDFIICNTDAKALEQSKVANKIQLGPHLTQGLGAGANPEVGKKATEESLQEIKSILEVNTKMAFITAGMGGGTGTGGAPIVAQICKDLGILTVGIVTTPFAFEGPKRMKQAEEGIKQLKPYVDTLLVISNDKLRLQYGNLKMKEAFSKADNVLATAAKCITDIINSRGHIIVDFADVCTVMKNGGVAILGKAEVEGEDRAQRAIEEALNSPLLNDNDIRGAKWILININSNEGDHECTMDELEIINNYLRMQAGEDTDVIVGMGYDTSLDKKIGITLVATGFDTRDPFAKPNIVKKPEAVPEKIIMTLGVEGEEKKLIEVPVPFQQQSIPFIEIDPLAPELKEVLIEDTTINIFNKAEDHKANSDTSHKKEGPLQTDKIQFELTTEISENGIISSFIAPDQTDNTSSNNDGRKTDFKKGEPISLNDSHSFLSKPFNIYADQLPNAQSPELFHKKLPEEESKINNIEAPQNNLSLDNNDTEMHLISKNENEGINKQEVNEKLFSASAPIIDNIPAFDENEEQRRRAAERIQKLRNLSFNMNSPETNSEFDAVPAYIRRNMELFGNTLTSVENFYSKYTVGKDENNNAQISTINTFLDGKKPD
jgi:cell division protein FtsZ